MVAKIGDFGVACTLPSLREDPLEMSGAILYMPPEAAGNYGLPLDIFSLGILALYTIIQQLPLRKDYGKVTFRTELERRGEYMQQVYCQLHCDNPLVWMIKQCLRDNPRERPRIQQVLQLLERARADCYDEDCHMNKLQLIQTVAEKNEMIDDLSRKNSKLKQARKKSLALLLQEKGRGAISL